MSRKIKALVVTVIAVALLWASVLPNSAYEITRYYGDINNDGYVTTEDARIALLVASGIYETKLYGLDFEAADVDNDSAISTQDALKILRVAAGQDFGVLMEGYEFSENPEEFANLINQYRFDENHDAVKYNLSPELCSAARIAAEEYALKTGSAFVREDGTYYYKLLDELGIQYTCADKIVIHSGFGYEQAVKQIIADSQAEKSLISDNFRNIGVGAFSSDGRTFYWCVFLTK